MAQVWIDAELCTGCGMCVSACPVGAIALVESRARLDPDLCQGCEVCVEVCPVSAIRRVVEVEIVDTPERALASQAPVLPVQREPAPLTETVTAVAAAAVTGLALRLVRAASQAVSRWLLTPRELASTGQAEERAVGLARSRPGGERGGRQVRRRQRGR